MEAGYKQEPSVCFLRLCRPSVDHFCRQKGGCGRPLSPCLSGRQLHCLKQPKTPRSTSLKHLTPHTVGNAIESICRDVAPPEITRMQLTSTGEEQTSIQLYN